MVDFAKLSRRNKKWKEIIIITKCGCDTPSGMMCIKASLDKRGDVYDICQCRCHSDARKEIDNG
jgi:hypothetical protein